MYFNMTPEQREQIEENIKNDFENEKKELDFLRSQILNELDEVKKEELSKEIEDRELELKWMEDLINKLKELQEDELNSLREKLEWIKDRGDLDTRSIVELKESVENPDAIHEVPTTYEMLRDSDTCEGLLNVIKSNPLEFKDVPWDSAEAKLEYIFKEVRENIVQFLENKFGNLTTNTEVINKTMAPAMEWSLMQLLRKQWNEKNWDVLKWLNKISVGKLSKLIKWVTKFAEWKNTSEAFGMFDAWINALDFLAVHNRVLNDPKKSEILTNPIKFQQYLNDTRFSNETFSPYSSLSLEDYNQLFWITDKDLEYWLTYEEKNNLLNNDIDGIGNIRVEPNANTTSLIVKLLWKSEKFLSKTENLQNTANHLLDWIDSINNVTKIFWIDILWEVGKLPEERSFLFKIFDFVCKLIWITWWLEWIVKNRRMDRLDLTPDKNDNICKIFVEYQELIGNDNHDVSITDKDSCLSVLNEFTLHDIKDESSSRGDKLRDAMADNMDINLISPKVVQECLWDGYLKKDEVTENGKRKEKLVIDESKIDESTKKNLAHKHVANMLQHFNNYDDLKDFYSTISTVDDLALCMTASLYADKNDVIEWIKAKVFLPDNYGILNPNMSDSNNLDSWSGRENLDSMETWEKNHVTEQFIYDKAVDYWITDKRQLAYILSTVSWESAFKNIAEIWLGQWHEYWVPDSMTWKTYYGRWFIQLTWKSNYEKYTQIIRNSWLDFKDNNGNTIKWSEVDLVNDPDLILASNDLAVFILVDWMKNGWPYRVNTKRLDYYFNSTKEDYYNARIIINGMSSSPQKYASVAKSYYNKLTSWEYENPATEKPMLKESILIWPKLYASNKDEIAWLWNSIMCGFQWYKNKTNFPNMDGIESKNTRTHEHRFNSKTEVHDYLSQHPGIKSFMFYFWANNTNNWQTLYDIKQWSEWLSEEWVQPVLCTCIWEERHNWLVELNTKLKDLWKEKNWPVLDFSSAYNEKMISMWWDHPNGDWYSIMAGYIDNALSV